MERLGDGMTMTKLAGGTAAVSLGAIAALHGIWTRSPWPLADRAELARKVVGVAEPDLPTPELTAAVATALGAASYLVADQAGLVPRVVPRRVARPGVWGLTGVLLLRGAAGLVTSGPASRRTDYTRRDLALYSPLCLTLGGLTAYVAATTRASRGRVARSLNDRTSQAV